MYRTVYVQEASILRTTAELGLMDWDPGYRYTCGVAEAGLVDNVEKVVGGAWESGTEDEKIYLWIGAVRETDSKLTVYTAPKLGKMKKEAGDPRGKVLEWGEFWLASMSESTQDTWTGARTWQGISGVCTKMAFWNESWQRTSRTPLHKLFIMSGLTKSHGNRALDFCLSIYLKW